MANKKFPTGMSNLTSLENDDTFLISDSSETHISKFTTLLTLVDKVGVDLNINGKADQVDLLSHVNNTNDPHSVTATQVGLSQVDNTSDLNKPISTATQIVIDHNYTEHVALSAAISGAGGGLEYWTESEATTGVNLTIPVASFTPSTTGANVDVAITPKGTGSILAQIPDGTPDRGNKRGINSVDLQTNRTGNYFVASGASSFIGSGTNNRSSGDHSVVVGGENNQAPSSSSFVGGGWGNSSSGGWSVCVGGYNNDTGYNYSVCVGGYNNSVDGTASIIVGGYYNEIYYEDYSFIGGGYYNNIEASYATIVGGDTNSIDSDYSFIGGGADNSIYWGSTYATIGGGRRNEIRDDYGTVGGGYYNDANGRYSTIAGGADGDADGDYSTIAGGDYNEAVGDLSFVGGGSDNDADGIFSAIVGGDYNDALGLHSFVGCGVRNVSTGSYSFIGNGYYNEAISNYSTIVGGSYAQTTIYGQQAFASGRFLVTGDAQSSKLVLRASPADDTPILLTTDGLSIGSTTNQLILKDDQDITFVGTVTAKTSGSVDHGSWKIEGTITRGTGVASTVLLASTVTEIYNSTTLWTLGLTADIVNGGLSITFIGEPLTNIKVVGSIDTSEVLFT